MMLSAIFSFLGGSVFRMVWGEVSAYLSRKQDHQFEIERLKLQAEHDAMQHARNLEAIRVQAELGVKTIQVQAEAAVNQLETEGWLEAVKATGRSVGVAWVDAWNAVIRPGVATWAVGMLTLNEFSVFKISEATASVAFAALGIYLADRTLGKRGK
jgi:hypothetical protein